MLSYLDINDVSFLVDTHVCGQGDWACEVNANNSCYFAQFDNFIPAIYERGVISKVWSEI